jgi:amino acid adenylation domain-containing protein/thioester reductase-like protein
MPLTPNDKIDRRALPAPSSSEISCGEFVAPRNVVEEKLVEIWKRMLKREHISVLHSFFDLGGHSLLAARLMSRIRKEMNVKLSIANLFEAPTIAGLAKIVRVQSLTSNHTRESTLSDVSVRGQTVVVGSLLRSKSLTQRMNHSTSKNKRLRIGSIGNILSSSSVSGSVRDTHLTAWIQENSPVRSLRCASSSQLPSRVDMGSSLRVASAQETPFSSSILRRQRLLHVDQGLHEDRQGENNLPKHTIDLPKDCHQMSYNQRSLYFLQRVLPSRVDYNVHHVSNISSAFDVDRLRQCFTLVAEHHKSLTTTFSELDGVPFQQMNKHVQQSFFTEVDSTFWTREDLMRKIHGQIHNPFDLRNDPVFKVHVYQGGSSHACLLITAHHIAIDGVSLDLVLRDVGRCYKYKTDRSSIDDPVSMTAEHHSIFETTATSVFEFASLQSQYLNSTEGERLWQCWQRELLGHTTLNLQCDFKRPAVQETKGDVVTVEIQQNIVQNLKLFAQHNNVTTYTVLLTVFSCLLHKYSGQDDILIGSPMSGRTLDDTQLEESVGNFVNPVCIRSTVTDELTFRQKCEQMFGRVINALEWQAYPFALLVERMANFRDNSRSPLFQVLFSLNQSFLEDEESGGSTGERINLGGIILSPMANIQQSVSPFDISLVVTEGSQDHMTAAFQYATSLFKRSTVERMSKHFLILLNNALARPDIALSNINMLAQAETDMLVREWNDTDVPFESDICVHTLFERQVKKTPHAVALTYGDKWSLSYAELNCRANTFANFLRSRGVRHQSLIGILMRRSADMVVCMLACLKSGACYVPIDPSYPSERIAYMCDDAQIHLLVTQIALLENVPMNIEHQTCVMDADWNISGILVQAQQYAVENEHRRNLPLLEHQTSESLMYVIYTSGSTGKPKGVQIEHRSFVNVVQWHQRTYSVTNSDRASQIIGPSFDPVGLEVYPILLAGGSLHICDEATRVDPPKLLQWLLRLKITICLLSTPVAELALKVKKQDQDQELAQGKWPRSRLRVLYTGGDKLTLDGINRSKIPFRFDNHYGPSEATIISSYYPVCLGAKTSTKTTELDTDTREKRSTLPPIGLPIDNYQLLVLDSALNVVPIGVAGELYIGGKGLARGYLHRPALTKERFISTPESLRRRVSLDVVEYLPTKMYKSGDLVRRLEDGNIEFLGRVDQQIKIRGLRIELGEIEAAILSSSVNDCCVIVREDIVGSKKITAYVVLKAQSNEMTTTHADPQSQLRSVLKKTLPDYMVPTQWMFMDALPLTPNGKIDRRALPQPTPESQTSDYVEPQGHTEIVVATLMKDILGLPSIGAHDNFFDLGLHSLTSTLVLQRLLQDLKVEISIGELFSQPTVAGVAKVYETKVGQTNKNSATSSPIAPFLPEEEIQLPADIRCGSKNNSFNFSDVAKSSHILLTGATGFLGAFLLAELLESTSATIHCLIRVDSTSISSKEPAHRARSKLRANLEKYQLFSKFSKSYDMLRVYPVVVGDLEKVRLGMSEHEFKELAETVDAVYHAGCFVHSLYPYSKLRNANVRGTIELLRLACLNPAKAIPFFYVSSLSVFPGSGTIIRDDESNYELPLSILSQLSEGYAQTKVVAERLCVEAGKRGIPVKIFRPGRIVGAATSSETASTTSSPGSDDIFSRIIKGCLQMGAAPASLEWPVDMNPVDRVAHVIVHASFVGFGKDGACTIPHAYHMYHPKPLSLNTLFEWLIHEYNYKIEMISYSDWRKLLETACAKATDQPNALFPVFPIFPRDPTQLPSAADYPIFDCKTTFAVCGIQQWFSIDDASLTAMFDTMRNVDDEFPTPTSDALSMQFEFD